MNHPLTKEEVIRVVGDYLMLLAVRFSPSAKKSNIYCACFPLLVDETPVLVTAGHCITKLNESLPSGDDFQCSVIVGLGSRAGKLPLPSFVFDYHKSQKDLVVEDIGINRTCLDVGIILLPEHYWAAFRSFGVVPAPKEKWSANPDEKFYGLAVLGFPSELQIEGAKPAVVLSHKLEGHSSLWYEMTFSEQDNGLAGTGLSGGPVFGFRAEPDGLVKYGLVGVMSRCFLGSRVMRATSTKAMIETITFLLERIKKGESEVN